MMWHKKSAGKEDIIKLININDDERVCGCLWSSHVSAGDVDASGLVLLSLTQRKNASGPEEQKCEWVVFTVHGSFQ